MPEKKLLKNSSTKIIKQGNDKTYIEGEMTSESESYDNINTKIAEKHSKNIHVK